MTIVNMIDPRKNLCASGQQLALRLDVNLAIIGKQGLLAQKLIYRLRAHPERDKRLFWFKVISIAWYA